MICPAGLASSLISIGGTMDLILTGVFVGVLGTLAMDLLNHLFARTGVLLRIDVGMIGRMSAGWARGRFCYSHPSKMKPVANEKLIGYITHYSIGMALAIPFVLGWAYFFEGPASPVWALAYYSNFLVYTCIYHILLCRRRN